MPQAPHLDPRPHDAFLRATRTRVVIVGAGIAGLVAALEWAKIGATVTVVEAADVVGGDLETVVLDGLPVDAVADAFALGSARLTRLLEELHLTGEVDPVRPHPVWVVGAGIAGPLPEAAVVGIPANLWSDDVRRLIGGRGAWRAYLDRLRPPLTIGIERSLGNLVRTRMGARVVDRLVAPVTRGLYGIDPDDVDVEIAAPGLSAALTRAGSLAGAVGQLLPDDPVPTRATLRGGMSTLVDALAGRLADLGADVRTGARAVALGHDANAPWTVVIEAEPNDASADADDTAPLEPTVLAADVVVVATDAVPAAALLRSVGIAAHVEPVRERDVVTLVVDAPQLDGAPRGRAVYPLAPSPAAPTTAAAPALRIAGVTQPTAEAAWLAAAAGPGRHVVRVVLDAVPATCDDDVVIAAAQAGAAELLGIAPIVARAAVRRRVVLDAPASALGHSERCAAVRDAVCSHPGIAVVGGWLSGSGIAQVVTDAAAEVDRLRSAVLWGPDDE